MVKFGKVVILRAVVLEMEVTAAKAEDGREIEVIDLPTRRHMAKGPEEDIARLFPAGASRCNLIRHRNTRWLCASKEHEKPFSS
jgi:hypothetical protein